MVKYDQAGNILLKKNYIYSLEDNLYSPNVDEYIYDCEGIRDRLISFNNSSISYDDMGRPITYKDDEFEWNELGQLSYIFTSDGDEIEYLYDIGGVRREKVVNGVSTKIISNGNQVLAMKQGNNSIVFRYVLNKLIGFTYNNGGSAKEYVYDRNIQGDIIGIYDSEGNQVGGYAYDAYGNHVLTIDIEGIGSINPFRYKGYFYDSETGLYYLNSRYYDPETGRFISPDVLTILEESKGQINGLNLYMYCNDNPVMYVDPSGYSWDSFWKDIGNWFSNHWQEIVVGTLFIIAGAVVTALTCGTGVTALGAFGAAMLSSAQQVGISIGTSILINGINSVLSGGGFFDNFGASIASGYMWGGIFSGGAQMIGGFFRAFANAGAVTGRKGGIEIGKTGIKIFSPDKNNWPLAGGTIIKIGSKFRLDVGAMFGLHIHIANSGHIAIGAIIAGLLGAYNYR